MMDSWLNMGRGGCHEEIRILIRDMTEKLNVFYIGFIATWYTGSGVPGLMERRVR